MKIIDKLFEAAAFVALSFGIAWCYVQWLTS